jgi:hypothetical protein
LYHNTAEVLKQAANKRPQQPPLGFSAAFSIPCRPQRRLVFSTLPSRHSLAISLILSKAKALFTGARLGGTFINLLTASAQ